MLVDLGWVERRGRTAGILPAAGEKGDDRRRRASREEEVSSGRKGDVRA